jgi:RNA polymerase sigma-70 factor, ECF subfamily
LFKRKNTNQLSDAELVDLAKIKHVHFGVLYERYFDKIFRFVFNRLGGDEATTGDLTQQTFLKAMANIQKYEDRGLPFCSWLYRIAQNEVNLFFRENKKAFTVEIEDWQVCSIMEEASIGKCMSVEDQEKLVLKLNGLPQESIDLIELRFFQELSFKEIADIYTITEANAKMRIYRILEKMSKNWKEAQ